LAFSSRLAFLGCKVELIFVAGSVPPVSLAMALIRSGVRVTMEGSILVDDLSIFLQMQPRPTQTLWPVAAMAQIETIDWTKVPLVVASDDAVVNHFEGCCPAHLVTVAARVAELFPHASTVCWTTDSQEGVRVLSRELRRLWTHNVMKACLVSSIEDVL